MAHHIHENDSMLAVGEAPWHGTNCTTMAESPKSALEALQISGQDWEVQKQPMFLAGGEIFPGEQVIVTHPSDEKKTGAHGAIVRMDNRDILGVVGPGYTPLQNREMAALFEPIVADGSVTIETCGSLFNGRRVWMLAKFGANEVVEVGDEVAKYLLLAHGHDGTFAVRFGFTPIRVVCYNTLSAASDSSESKLVRCLHTSGLADNLKVLRDAMQLGEQVFSLTADQYRKLQRTGCNRADLREFARVVIDANADSSKWTGSEGRKVAAIVENATYGRGNSGLPNWWTAYNGVTEYVCHQAGRTQERRVSEAWWGAGKDLSARALATALTMSGVA